MRRKITRWVIWYMVTVMFLLGITPRVEAAFSPSEVVGQPSMNRIADLEKIQKVIEVKMIRERLSALGLSQEEIQARLIQMSNDQVHQLAVKLDELKVGGDNGVTVLIVLVIVAIAILVVYLMGYRLILKKG
jgi:hypothetical protein